MNRTANYTSSVTRATKGRGGTSHTHHAVAEVLQLVRITGLRVHAEQAGVVVRGVEGSHAVGETVLRDSSGQPTTGVMRGPAVLAPLPQHALHHLQKPHSALQIRDSARAHSLQLCKEKIRLSQGEEGVGGGLAPEE